MLRPAVACLCLLAAPLLAGETFNVTPDEDITDIQSVIDDAADGDTIKFAKGTYPFTFPLFVDIDGITLKGSKAVLDGQYIDTPLIVRGDRVTVTGFTVVHGGFDDSGAGIEVRAAGEGLPPDKVVITKNIIKNCAGDGIRVHATDATIEKNVVIACQTGIGYRDNGTGVEGIVSESVIAKNRCELNEGDGIRAEDIAGQVIIEKNTCTVNEDQGIDLSTLATEEVPPPGGDLDPSRITKNKSISNGDEGILVEDVDGRDVIVEGNTSALNENDGIFVNGQDIVVRNNKVGDNVDYGIRAFLFGGEVSGNRVQGNRLDGIVISGASFGEGTSSNALVDGNKVSESGGDGIRILTSNNMVTNNKSQKNLGDGIDVEAAASVTLLEGNTCTANGHEGIDDGGTNTDIIGNKCKKNFGVDIAGDGDFPGGDQLGEFTDNTFDTGGDDVASTYDDPDEDDELGV